MNEIEGMDVNINGMKISILMYAGDLVLLSQTENGLQRGINALHSFCIENNLTVNTSKCKVQNWDSRSVKTVHTNLFANIFIWHKFATCN